MLSTVLAIVLSAAAPTPLSKVFQDYQHNEVKADLKYHDHPTAVRGTVAHVGKNDKGEALVMLTTDSAPDWVVVCFPHDDAKLVELEDGQPLTATITIGKLAFEHDTHVLKLTACKL